MNTANLTRNERVNASLERLDEVRRQQQTYSQQPRFGSRDTRAVFNSIYKWLKRADLEEPEYEVDSRERDKWLSTFWRKEAHLAGVINSTVSIDKNRAWSLIGGRNQVKRFTEILRKAENGAGWRYYINQQSQAYYTTDIGAITELGRDGMNGPVRALYTLDSTLCRMTGKVETPLRYDNTKDPWGAEDFIRTVSLPSFREDLYGLGYCAVSRVLEMAKIMIAVYEHDLEMLGARSPKGILLLNNISRQQWDDAMAAREAQLTAREQEWFGAVGVIADEGMGDMEAKLVALSQLPAGFNIETTTNLLMYAYALCFGYDPIEFWPVAAGALGRGRETEIQHEKATGKGGADFMLSFQDRLQESLPETLTFEFDQRDEKGDLLSAEVMQAQADVVNSLYAAGAGAISREEARSLLSEWGLIPPEWTEIEEEAESTDVDDAGESQPVEPQPERSRHVRERMLENDRIRRAIVQYPSEPIVRYSWPSGRMQVVWQRGEEALQRQRWQVLKPVPLSLPVHRQDEDEILFQGEDFTITEADVDDAIDEGGERVGDEFEELLRARTLTDEELDTLDAE